jgi:uncharacterized cupredoxin-like copper-binding protein
MNSTLNLAALVLALSASMTVGPVFAHGKSHSEQQVQEVIKEQKAWGIAGDIDQVDRIIEVSMTDQMRFTPDRIEVKLGETIRFIHRNEGQMLHEFVLGTKQNLDEHAAMMVKFPGMEHDEPYMAHVGPGKREEIVWTFNRAGEFDFACLIAGHYQAGMVGKITVLAN